MVQTEYCWFLKRKLTKANFWNSFKCLWWLQSLDKIQKIFFIFIFSVFLSFNTFEVLVCALSCFFEHQQLGLFFFLLIFHLMRVKNSHKTGIEAQDSLKRINFNRDPFCCWNMVVYLTFILWSSVILISRNQESFLPISVIAFCYNKNIFLFLEKIITTFFIFSQHDSKKN